MGSNTAYMLLIQSPRISKYNVWLVSSVVWFFWKWKSYVETCNCYDGLFQAFLWKTKCHFFFLLGVWVTSVFQGYYHNHQQNTHCMLSDMHLWATYTWQLKSKIYAIQTVKRNTVFVKQCLCSFKLENLRQSTGSIVYDLYGMNI